MAKNFRDQLEEIKATLSSPNTKSQNPYAYSTLLSLQELAANDPSLMQILADSAQSLVSSIVVDMSRDDEEIATQALKCLGFMIYHPSIVQTITDDIAGVIIDSLLKVITNTRIKSVCNLGVWCISVQQLSATTLSAHFHSLLRAVVHALDNPIGSLSTTFEAMQAVMKLTTLFGEKMRDMSNIWAPPIYRRIVSADKREREISERCLLKIRFMICPAPVSLSKALVSDVKRKLLSTMKELLNQGMKVQTMQAWGWFIRFLGPFAIKYKHLLNEMLKLPEKTFSDFDPQVQIASLVAWEGLIDALILLPVQYSESVAVLKHGTGHMTISKKNSSQTECDIFFKRIKLIMTPLVGIMSSKCDISVQAACLNTWSYLLHKLDTYTSSSFAIKSVWEPILEVVFQFGPDNRSVWLWNVCIDLLDALLSARSAKANRGLNNQETSSVIGPLKSGKCSLKHYQINWSPWDLGQLKFFIKMMHIVINQGSNASAHVEFRRMTENAALRLFRSLLRSIQAVLKCPSTTYDEVMLCLTTVLRFLKEVCDNVTSEHSYVAELPHASLQLLEVVSEEIEPSILESPLYKVALDINCPDRLEQVGKLGSAIAPDIWFWSYLDMVSPVVYLNVLYFSVAVKSTAKVADINSVLNRMYRHVKLLLSLYDPLEILHVFVGLLYMYELFNCLGLWKTLANCLKDYMQSTSNLSLSKDENQNRACSLAIHLLSYPFAVCSLRQIQLELHDVFEVWKELYVSINHASEIDYSLQKSFPECLFSILNGYLDEITITVNSYTEHHPRERNQEADVPRERNQEADILLLSGNVITCVLEQLISRLCTKGSKINDGIVGTYGNIKTLLGLAARFMNLASAREETAAPISPTVISRLFSVLIHYIDRLQFEDDILIFIEIMTSPLITWLSLVEVTNEETKIQFQLLWITILKSLQRSRSSIKFDYSFLQIQGSLLERTLDHPNISISEPTVDFWNSTYGLQLQLEYPQNLLPVLDKLMRNGKINICRRNLAINKRNSSGTTSAVASPRCTVTATLTGCSKRVELMKNAMNDTQGKNKVHLSSKRKRPELTEHQKEVRRAQQGRVKDCNGHGPGIRTYTSVDFSQGNEELQESQEIRGADSILEILKRGC